MTHSLAFLHAFIQAHGNTSRTVNGMIEIASIASARDPKTGEVFVLEVIDTVEPTLAAVRSILGY